MAKCKLCLEEKQLIKKSHIIPEFMYQDLYDDKHKMIVFTPAEMARGEGFVKNPSLGEYESGLLCIDCESKVLSKYESYASKALYGGMLASNECPVFQNYINPDGLKYSSGTNISYSKIKIFFLSILWRASISSRPLFSEINLGEHEEILRKMILNGEPKEIDDYPIFFSAFVNDKNAPRNLIAQPQIRETETGHTSFIFIIGGMIYFFYLNSKELKIPKTVLASTIKPSNEMIIYHVPQGKSWDLLLGFYGLKNKPK